jgi:hypothetical protein
MALCERCGSISIVRLRPGPTDLAISILTGRKRFRCRRCGWRARRAWTDQELEKLNHYGAGGAEIDPSLAELDDISRQKRRQQAVKSAERKEDNFDLGNLHLATEPEPAASVQTAPAVRGRNTRRLKGRIRGQKRSRRREILAAIMVTAITMFLLVLISLSGSCAGGDPTF